MRPWLLLDTTVDPTDLLEHYGKWLGDGTVEVLRCSEAVPSGDPRHVRGVVITGSRSSVADGEAWIDGTAAWLRRAVDAGVPILGCCFGHQLLAHAIGGPGTVRKAARPEVGYPRIHVVASDPLFEGLAPGFRAFVSHEDEVVPSPALRVVARTDACPVHAFRVPGRRAWGIQFHVEYPLDEQARILWYRRERHPDLGLEPDAMLATAPDMQALARRIFDRFKQLADRG